MDNRYSTEQGLRHYIVNDERHYPSVTTILSATQSWSERKALENWGKRNPGGREKAAERGTAVHRWCEHYLLNREMQVPRNEEVASYITTDLVNTLQRLSIQKPLWVEHSLCTTHDFVWSEEYGYAGCPDWVSKFADPTLGPILTLVDLKTSAKRYERYHPLKGAKDYYERETGAKKFDKCAMQLMAYSYAFKETIGVMPTAQMMVIARPGGFQYLMLTKAEKDRAWDEFRRRCDAFYARYCKSSRTYQFPETEEEEKEAVMTVNAG